MVLMLLLLCSCYYCICHIIMHTLGDLRFCIHHSWSSNESDPQKWIPECSPDNGESEPVISSYWYSHMHYNNWCTLNIQPTFEIWALSNDAHQSIATIVQFSDQFIDVEVRYITYCCCCWKLHAVNNISIFDNLVLHTCNNMTAVATGRHGGEFSCHVHLWNTWQSMDGLWEWSADDFWHQHKRTTPAGLWTICSSKGL